MSGLALSLGASAARLTTLREIAFVGSISCTPPVGRAGALSELMPLLMRKRPSPSRSPEFSLPPGPRRYCLTSVINT